MASRLQYKLALAQQEESENSAKNKGNALSYVGKNLGAGALGMFEGAYDFIVGGAASLVGNDEYAKYLHANDISGRMQKQAMQEFNPSKGWQFAGDVASGLGQTAAGIGVGLLTGGLGGGAIATKLAVGATIGLGAAGKSTGGAYQKTGELGAKEYTYGALSGALEMGLETLTGAGGKIASRLTSQTATAVAKNAVRSGIVKTMISEGAGEFVEEALSEILDAPLQRITGIDKEAENANINDVIRAGLVGFVSGAIGSGIGSSAQNVSNLKRGTNIEKNGTAETILNRANTLKNEIVDNAEDKKFIAEPLKALSASVTAYESVKKQDSVKGRMLLGEIQKGLAYVEVSSGVQHSYNNIAKEAEAIANTAYFKENYKDYTAEDIKNNKNDIAKELAVNDFVGKMMISPEEYASTLKKGELPVGATKYQEFIAQADGNTIKRLSVELGIDLNTANYEEVRRHLADYSKTKGKSIAGGQIATYLNAIFGDVMEVDENGKINTKIKKLPKNIKVAVGEKAIYKTKDGTIVGIVHHEKGYFVGIDEVGGEKGFQTANTLNESEFAEFISTVRRKFNGETDTAVKATTKAQTAKVKETKVADVKEENKTKKAEVKKEEVVIDSQKLKAVEETVASDEGIEETKAQKDVNIRLKKEQAKARALESINKSEAEKTVKAEKKAEEKTVIDEVSKDKEKSQVAELKTEKVVKKKIEDFGEKIGGARKDLWKDKGIDLSTLSSFNERERKKYIKKDNIWKKPDYTNIGDNTKEQVYIQKVIRDSITQKVCYLYADSTELLEKQRQDEFVKIVGEIKSITESITSQQDLSKLEQYFIDNGYIELSMGGYRATSKLYATPVISTALINNVLNMKKWSQSQILKNAEKEQIGIAKEMKVPKGYTVSLFRKGSKASKLVNGEWVDMSDKLEGTYSVNKGYGIVKEGIATYEEAVKTAQEHASANQKTRKKVFTPKQLVGVHREGADYRKSKIATGNMYLKDFKFRGGEFGNWLNENDRAQSLNYGYDAFMDLSDALNISREDISFGGELSVAFGARGQGLSGAVAHYEPTRKVINLTKMKGAGSLAHEWAHALDDYVGGKTGHSGLASASIGNTVPKLFNVVNTMRYNKDNKRTEFYKNSIAFDSGNAKTDGRYWQSVEEMFARAFACYITDKTNAKSDYLSGHSDSVVDFGIDKDGKVKIIQAYPVGEERIAINKAFDELMIDLKERGWLTQLNENEKETATTKYAVKEVENTNSIKPEARGDLTQAKETARKYVKDFDMYDTDTKGRIVEAIISGEQYKVDETTQKAIANIVAKRKNLNVSFSNIAENGMYYTIKNEKGATQRYAVINPSTNIVRQTILHELTHDLEGDARFEAMSKVALQNTPKEKVDAKRKLYEKHYKKIGKEFNEDILTAEITADYFAEQLGESKFIERYATNENLGIFQRAKKWLSDFVAKLPLGKAKTEAIKLNRLYDRLIQGEWKGVEGTARIKHSLTQKQKQGIQERTKTVDFDDLTDLAQEIVEVGGEITQDGKVVVYHATNKKNAEIIKKTNRMYGKEDNLFFSTKKDGEILGYGSEIVQLQIPLEKLAIDDIFSDEAHLTMKVKPNTLTNVKFSLTDSNGNKLSKEQREYFKDSKIRSTRGNLDFVWHFTDENNNFNTFKPNDLGLIFVSTEPGAVLSMHWQTNDRYTSAIEKRTNEWGDESFYLYGEDITNIMNGDVTGEFSLMGQRIRPYYLNAKNPFTRFENDSDFVSFMRFASQEQYKKDFLRDYDGVYKEDIDSIANMDDGNIIDLFYDDVYHKIQDGAYEYRETKSFVDWLKQKGYDAFSLYESGFDESTNYAFFNPNQIKLTTNLNPTDSDDIRFSVDEVDTMDVVQTEVDPKKVSLKTIVKNKRYAKIAASDFVVSTQIMLTNDMAGAERVLRASKKTEKIAEAVSQEFRTAQAKGQAKLGNYQYDTVQDIYKADIKGKELGKGLHAIFEPINRRGTAYLAKFEDYVYNKHNIDRMAVGKTVNGASIIQSKAIVAEYERTNPEFKKYMKEVTDFCKNELKMDFDAGVISEEDYNFYVKRYGNYVPSYRDMTAEEVAKSFAMDTEMVRVSALAKKKATGSTIKILPLEYAIALQTLARERQIATNKMANLLYDAHLNGNTTDVTSVEKMEIDEADKKNPDKNYDKLTPKDNTVIFFRNGEQYSMQVSKYVFAGFDSLTKHFNKVDSAVIKAVEKANKGFKTLVTSANPLFIARNFSRDMQEALFYTKYGTAKFLKHYATAISQVKSNGDYWKLYQAMGGFNSSLFDFNTGKITDVNMRGFEKASEAGKLAMLKKVVLTCENANLLIEQLPRFAEFIASMENGNTAQQALVDSAEITCNFGRGGTLTRLLNRTIMPFLNPAVQGASKFVRNITGARTARAIGSLVLKATILGILPQMLSMAMYQDDEEYQGMTDYTKESYWLFKIGDTWAKIPKGRVTAFITSTYIHGDKVAKGDDAWENVKAVGKSFTQNLTPVENVGRTIFSPFYDIKTNTTWYGGSIENLGLQKAEPRNRYDESTSKIAIWLGDKINYSPKKIHYLFDQYSGIIGDILLPATNSKAEVDIFKNNFTVDPVTQNKYSQEFYDLVDEVKEAKDSALRAGDTEAETDSKLQARFLSNAQKGASDIFDEISKIQGSDLSNADKLAQVRVLRGTINQIYTTALTDIDAVREAIGATAYIDDYDLRYAEVTRLIYGAERALRTYNSKVYEKAQTINKAGISYQDYYEVYFKTRGIESEKDKQGNTIAGSKKKKVIKEIATLKIPTAQKLFLIYAQGYTIKDGEVKGFTEVRAKRVVATYIDELNLTAEERKTLIDLCGI